MLLNKNFDFVIIGSGPCGLLSASILSHYGTTLIVEEGQEIKESEKDIYTYEQITSGYLNNGLNMAYGLPLVLLSEAKCFGGGSTLNSSLHHRAPKYIWKKWREIFDIQGFQDFEVDLAYQEIENLFCAQKGFIKPSNFYQIACRFI